MSSSEPIPAVEYRDFALGNGRDIISPTVVTSSTTTVNATTNATTSTATCGSTSKKSTEPGLALKEVPSGHDSSKYDLEATLSGHDLSKYDLEASLSLARLRRSITQWLQDSKALSDENAHLRAVVQSLEQDKIKITNETIDKSKKLQNEKDALQDQVHHLTAKLQTAEVSTKNSIFLLRGIIVSFSQVEIHFLKDKIQQSSDEVESQVKAHRHTTSALKIKLYEMSETNENEVSKDIKVLYQRSFQNQRKQIESAKGKGQVDLDLILKLQTRYKVLTKVWFCCRFSENW
ncbi:hypothetical protein AAMO2058_001617700 [Amorphochlora amoebiformis]